MSQFVTNDILSIWTKILKENFGQSGCLIEREYTYINKPFPFLALHMGKKNDEYFLDLNNNRISNDNLLKNMELLIIKDFESEKDLSLPDRQAMKACSIADLFITNYYVEIILELEIFKDKPFSNLIYIPEICKHIRKKPLYFIHCFAPKRNDKEAVLTQKIGYWLIQHGHVRDFQYESYILPDLPEFIQYLLPYKGATKPQSYQNDRDKIQLYQYAEEFCNTTLIPSISKIVTQSKQLRSRQSHASIAHIERTPFSILPEEKMENKIVEITVNRTMINEINPIIPTELFEFFPPKEEVFRLDTSKGYSINAYLAVNRHIHNESGQEMKIQDWWRSNKPEVGDTLVFEKIANRHYKINLRKRG